MKSDRGDEFDPRGKTSGSWCCVDCGAATTNLAGKDTPIYRPEAYMVRNTVWKAAGMKAVGGCLCVGCLEKRRGRRLRPKDFTRHPFGTERLLDQRNPPADGPMR
jgi:hypothetical protein